MPSILFKNPSKQTLWGSSKTNYWPSLSTLTSIHPLFDFLYATIHTSSFGYIWRLEEFHNTIQIDNSATFKLIQRRICIFRSNGLARQKKKWSQDSADNKLASKLSLTTLVPIARLCKQALDIWTILWKSSTTVFFLNNWIQSFPTSTKILLSLLENSTSQI